MSSGEDRESELALRHSDKVERLGAKLRDGAALGATAVVGTCKMLTEAALQLAMITFLRGDATAFRDQLLAAANECGPPLFKAMVDWEEVRKSGDSEFDTYGPIGISELWHAFATFVLVGDWQAAERLAAHAIGSESVRGGRPMSDFVEAVFALMGNDALIIERSIASQENWPYEPEPLFLELTLLAQHVANREQPELDARLARADLAYKQRTKLKRSSSYGADLGVDRGYNELYFDYVSVVIGKIAKRRGMSVPEMGRLDALLADCS